MLDRLARAYEWYRPASVLFAVGMCVVMIDALVLTPWESAYETRLAYMWWMGSIFHTLIVVIPYYIYCLFVRPEEALEFFIAFAVAFMWGNNDNGDTK